MASSRVLGGLAVVLMVLCLFGPANAGDGRTMSLHGIVESDTTLLEGYEVSLHARFLGPFGRSRVLGRDTTGPSGGFRIDYRLPGWLPQRLQPLLFLRAENGSAMLASALGQAPVAGPVVVNERTTVATGFAFAQFVDGAAIDGNRVVCGPLGGRCSTAATVPVSGCARFAAMRAAFSTPYSHATRSRS